MLVTYIDLNIRIEEPIQLTQFSFGISNNATLISIAPGLVYCSCKPMSLNLGVEVALGEITIVEWEV